MKVKAAIARGLLVGFSSSAWAAARAVFIPAPPPQAMLIVQKVNMDTGAMDNDPEILYDAMKTPERGLPSGDKGKMLQTADGSVLLSCIHRVGTNVKQCQFHIKDSPFSKIDKSGNKLGYYREDQEAEVWYSQFEPGEEGKFLFVTSDEKLQFYLTPEWMEISFVK